MFVDYRVWRHILTALERHFKNSSSEDLAQNAAFQIAVCCSIGFGARRDLDRSKLWLERSSEDKEKLQSEKGIVANIFDFTEDSSYRSSRAQTWSRDGIMTAFDLIHDFRRLGLLSTLKADYANISLDLEKAFSRDNTLVLYQKMVICDILEAEGNYEFAEDGLYGILIHVNRCREMLSKPMPFFMVSVVYRLVNVLIVEEKLVAAEECTRDLLQGMERNYGNESMSALKVKVLVGEVLMRKSEFEEAERMLRSALVAFENKLGDNHASTIAARARLQPAYLHLQKYEKLEQECEQSSKETEKVFESHQRDHILHLANLSVALESRRKYVEAREKGQAALKASEKVLGG